MWWGAGESRRQLERTRLSSEVAQGCLRLRAGMCSAFTRTADAVEQPPRVRDVREAEERRRIPEGVRRLRASIEQENAATSAGSERNGAGDLARLAEIEAGLLRIFARFREAKALIAAGRAGEAEPLLDGALRAAGVGGLGGLADAAVREAEAAAAYARAAAALERVALLPRPCAAAVASLGGGALPVLPRRLREPLAELEAAAEAVRAGDRGRRARAGRARGESARVAESFDAMVEEVVAARDRLRWSRRGLEAAVAARTAGLAAANAALREADAARRRFFADISHELRTPLTVIRGEAEVTLRGSGREPAECRAALSHVAEQAAQTARLADDLLFLGARPRAAARPPSAWRRWPRSRRSAGSCRRPGPPRPPRASA